jgi:hypothetical protein
MAEVQPVDDAKAEKVEPEIESGESPEKSAGVHIAYVNGPRIKRKKTILDEYTNTSLYIFKPTNPIRLKMLDIAKATWFDRIILGLILLNCVFLCAVSWDRAYCSKFIDEATDLSGGNVPTYAQMVAGAPAYTKQTKLWNDGKCTQTNYDIHNFVSSSELFFTLAFTLESVIKIIAFGFIMDEGAYLRDGWNWLDFIVVIISWASMLPNVDGVSSLRTFRVLRPLRTLTTVPGMRIIVQSMISSLPAMAPVVALAAFMFFVWGIIGIQLWAGLFDARCHYEGHMAPVPGLSTSNITCGEVGAVCMWQQTSTASEFTLNENDGDTCALAFSTKPSPECNYGNDGLNTCMQTAGGRACGPATFYNGYNGSITLPQRCKRVPKVDGPGWGATDFDNIGAAILTIFTGITLEGWVDSMYNVKNSFGAPLVPEIYFVSMVMFGAFFLMNLALAVIWEEYQDAQKEDEALQEEEELAHQQAEAKAAGLPKPTHVTHDPEENKAAKDVGNTSPSDTGPRLALFNLVENAYFGHIITLFIIANTVVMAMEYHGMPASYKLNLSYCNLVFTIVFIIEMLMKWIGLGFKQYFADGFNKFDCVIVVFSVIELIAGCAGGDCLGASAIPGISVLRLFRMLRVFKLARNWVSLRLLLNTILNALLDVANAAILLGIVMFIFCLVGIQLFAGQFSEENFGGDKPRAHFDSLGWSFVTVFQVLTGENWNEIIYNGMHVPGSEEVAVIYFVLLNVVGNYLVMNLFMAILLAKFEEDDEDEEESTPTATAAVSPAEEGTAAISALENPASADDEEETEALEALKSSSMFIFGKDNALRGAAFKLIRNKKFDNFILFLIAFSSILLAIDEPYVSRCHTMGQEITTAGKSAVHASIPLYSEQCSMAPESYASLVNITGVLDTIITFLFIFEMLAKWLALGVVMHKGSYWRNGWNILDGTLVLISIVGMIMAGAGGGSNLKALRALRALRGLRPLRVVSRDPGMKLVVNSLFRALPAIGNVAMVTMLFFLIFAIVGVQNFAGIMHVCNDESKLLFTECVGTFNLTFADGNCGLLQTPQMEEACVNSALGTPFPRLWEPPPYNFDDTLQAIVTLYEVSSGEMWPDIQYEVVDSVGINVTTGQALPRQFEFNQYVSVYFIAVTLVCAFLMINVFVGVVIDNYNSMKAEADGSALITNEQRMWVEQMKLALSSSPMKMKIGPKEAFRMPFYKLSVNKKFEGFVMALILLNTLLMATRTSNQTPGHTKILEIGNQIFAHLFALEFIIKFTGLGFKQYFAENWNRFDFTLVILAYVGIAVDLGSIATLFRIFRVARVFRLVKTSPGVLNLFKTLVYSLPSLKNVGTILVLLMFIFATVCMNLFGNIKMQENINSNANFGSFFDSFMSLFRCLTGESYNALMHDAEIQPPFCSPEDYKVKQEIGTTGTFVTLTQPSNCGVLPPPYFPLSFLVFGMYFLFSNYVMLNLIIAIILDEFADTVALAAAEVKEENIENFREMWMEFDHNADSHIAADQLVALICKVDYPLGMNNCPGVTHEPVKKQQALDMSKQLDIPLYNNEDGKSIVYAETLHALCERALKANASEHEPPKDMMQAQITAKLEKNKTIRRLKSEVSSDGSIKEHAAAAKLQSAYRDHVTTKRRKSMREGIEDDEEEATQNQ